MLDLTGKLRGRKACQCDKRDKEVDQEVKTIATEYNRGPKANIEKT
jgi:hypothetical protein